jgi:hypothetical protein
MFASRGRELMPVEEGVAHFLRELFAASPEPEVTAGPDIEEIVPEKSRNGIRSLSQMIEGAASLPLIDGIAQAGVFECHLEADRDPFLTQHRQGRVAIMPAVVMIELMAEAARLAAGTAPARLEDVVIHAGVKLGDTRRLVLRALATPVNDGVEIELRAEHFGPRGRLLSFDKLFASATARVTPCEPARRLPLLSRPPDGIFDVRYDSAERLHRRGPERWVHGEDLRTLEEMALMEGDEHWGSIRAVAPSRLRPAAEGAWLIPAPAFDGALVACSLVANLRLAVDGLPARFGSIHLGRAAAPDERLTAVVRKLDQDERHVRYDLSLFGTGGTPLLTVEDYVLRTFTSIADGIEASEVAIGEEP